MIKEKGYRVGLNPLSKDDSGKMVIDEFNARATVREHYPKQYELLKCFGANEDYPPLHACVVEGRIDLVQRLLTLGMLLLLYVFFCLIGEWSALCCCFLVFLFVVRLCCEQRE